MDQRGNLIGRIEVAKRFTKTSGLLSYFGAWMPRDNLGGTLVQEEVENFARFFVNLLKMEQIPWSLNVIDNYYDTKRLRWKTKIQDLAGADLNISTVLESILEEM